MLTTTNIWELSSQMTKTLRDNCDTNIVQQTSCEPVPDVQMQLKMYFIVPFVRPCMHHNWCNFRKSCTWASARGAKRAFSALEIETKNEECLEKLESAAQFRSLDLMLAIAVYLPV